MRLIDVDGFIGILKDLAEDGAESIKISEVIYVLNYMPTRLGIPFDAPTVDAVEVVRCKDCHHFEPFDCPDGWGICRLNGNSYWKGSDHCSYGCE